MNVSDVQMVLAEVGLYSGAIDGDAGPKTWGAVRLAEKSLHALYQSPPNNWADNRRLVGAAQAALVRLGSEPGPVDGYAGHNTEEALTQWRSAKLGVWLPIEREIPELVRSHPNQLLFPRQRDMAAFYGEPGGAQCTSGKVDLPYPMILAWNKSRSVQRFSCHAKVEQPMTGIFRETLAHYGQTEIERLGLNLFGGCYNYRKMRGGTALSTHASGIATDLDPERNQLRWGADRAQFARPEYEPFWAIVIAHGATPAGYAWGKDWMHFQFARL